MAEQLIIGIENGNQAALDRFNNDPESPERKTFREMFMIKIDSGIAAYVAESAPKALAEIKKQFDLWRKIYSEEGIELPSDEELLKLLPERQPGFGWMVITVKGMSISLAWAMCKKRLHILGQRYIFRFLQMLGRIENYCESFFK